MENEKIKKYDIEKITQTVVNERKMNSDFADDDLGMDFFKTMENVLEQIKEMEKNIGKRKNETNE